MAEKKPQSAIDPAMPERKVAVSTDATTLRKFGRMFFIVFCILAVAAWRKGSVPVAGVMVGLGVLSALVGQVAPTALAAPYRGWMAFAGVLHAISSRVLLAVIFFGLVTPLGVLMRLTGRDRLHLGKQKRDSYWEPREQRTFDKDYFTRPW